MATANTPKGLLGRASVLAEGTYLLLIPMAREQAKKELCFLHLVVTARGEGAQGLWQFDAQLLQHKRFLLPFQELLQTCYLLWLFVSFLSPGAGLTSPSLLLQSPVHQSQGAHAAALGAEPCGEGSAARPALGSWCPHTGVAAGAGNNPAPARVLGTNIPQP